MRPSLAPSRVLLTTDAVGGVWNHTLELARGLAACGVEVTLAVLGPRPAPAQLAAARSTAEVIVTELPLDWTGESSAAVEAAGQALARMATKVGAEIVHLNSPSLAARGAFELPLVIGCHSCVATWWEAMRHHTPLPPDLVRQRDLVAAGYACADILVAPSAAFARMTARLYALPQAPHVVQNGCDAASAGIRERSGILAAGRLWDEAKDIALLGRISGGLAVPIRVAGPLDAPHGGSAAFPRLQHLGVLGAAEMQEQFARSRVFVSPARYEPFGLAVLEAAQAGCALLLSDLPSFREIWQDAADYVTCGDDDAFLAALHRLLADDAYHARRSGAARAQSARYSRGAMAGGMMELYCRAIRNHRMREAAA